MAVSAADVKRLRELTGAGMLDCKKALEESDGDFDKAVELLRIKGAKDVGKRAARTAANGLIAAHLGASDHGVMLELACETDFVAKTEGFQSLAADVAAFVATQHPGDLDELLAAEYEAGRTVRELLDEANASMGEKIEIRRFERVEDGYVYVYLHKHDPALPPSVGALVQLDKEDEEVAKNVAQHIAAMAPTYLTADDVPADVVASEERIAREKAVEEGKPEAALDKIVAGRVKAFYKDACLVEQPWVRDNKVTIGAYLADNGLTITRFARFKVGQA
ncbi:MAG: elongation factor Ts [Actinobacteria bacterium]|nr:MAG: elongation factor Ts [Actinomycetota bacterium]